MNKFRAFDISERGVGGDIHGARININNRAS